MITYGTDIAMGIYATYFLMGVVSVLLVELIVLAIAAEVLKRRTKRMKQEWECRLQAEEENEVQKRSFTMKKMIAGCFKWIEDPEDETKAYAEFPDGLRLIFQDGKYIGWYNPNLTKEG